MKRKNNDIVNELYAYLKNRDDELLTNNLSLYALMEDISEGGHDKITLKAIHNANPDLYRYGVLLDFGKAFDEIVTIKRSVAVKNMLNIYLQSRIIENIPDNDPDREAKALTLDELKGLRACINDLMKQRSDPDPEYRR